MMFRPARLAVVVLSLAPLASVSACVKTQAQTPSPRPALATPAPPPRTHIPVSVEPVEAPPSAPAADPASPPAASRPRDTTTRVVPPAAAASTPPTPPPTAPPVPEAPAAVLQTSANIGELETRARRLIDEAVRDLSFVPQKELSAGAKDQFASAQRFVRLAREAVTSKNYLYAKELADKAAKLAKLLLKR